MQQILIETAASEIVQAARDEPQPPFVFVVGAGVSHPSIPLAAGIVEHCKTVAAKYGRSSAAASTSSSATYSHWFEKAYPQPKQRQTYLRSLIEKKPIPPAALRLAHLLSEGNVAKLVITPNFDDFISRALALFGVPHLICDHPGTVERIDAEQREIQIVHVHGSYWYYDCCNLSHEIAARAAPTSSQTMASLLDQLLQRRAPVVIGYGGWEEDVIMGALRRRLSRPLPYNLYWCCYRQAEADALPEWLRNHPHVRAVVPAPAARTPEAPSGGPDADVRSLGVDGRSEQPVLTAQRAIEALNRGLELELPRLIDDPLGHFADTLRGSLHVGEAADDIDLYGVREVIDRVQRALAREKAERSGTVENPTTSSPLDGSESGAPPSTSLVGPAIEALAPIRDALRRSQYREVVRLAREVLRASLIAPARIELAEALWQASQGLLDNSAEELEAYQVVADLLRELGHEAKPRHRVTEAKALLLRGIALGALGSNEEALEAYEEVERRFAGASEPEILECVTKALVARGYRLGILNRYDEALAAYEEVERRFGSAPEPPLRQQVANALFNRGATLGDLGRIEEAIAAYEEVDRRFGSSPERPLCHQAARALFNKGLALKHLGRIERAIAAYEEVDRRFGSAPELPLRELVAKALFEKGAALGDLSRNTEAIAAYEEVERCFGSASEPELLEQVARALVNKGNRLATPDRYEEALPAYEEVERRFGLAHEPRLRQQAARALFNKAVALGNLGRREEALAAYEDVERRFGDASEPLLREQVAKALLNQGLTLRVLGRADEGQACWRQLVERFDASNDPILQGAVARARKALAEVS